MSRYNYKGDLKNVAQSQLEFVSCILEENNIKKTDIEIQAVGKDGDNYMSNTKRVVVEENGQTIKMIAKFAPEDELFREMTHIKEFFYNEHVVYTKLMPKYRQLQTEAGIPEKEMFRHAECYGSLSEAPHEVILLEDLKVSEFEMLSRFEPISNEAVKLALKNFAVWHSLSFVLKNKEPKTYTAIKSQLKDLYTEPKNETETAKQYFQLLEESTISMMDGKKYKNACKNTIGNVFALARGCVDEDQDSEYAVIRQGDGWTNNMMFKLENNNPEECVLIDYQLVFECSPVYDVLFMLFISTDYEQRSKHYYEFIDHYYNELDKSLKNFGFEAKFVYPRSQFEADLKRYAKLSLAQTLMSSNFILKKPEEVTKTKEETDLEAMSSDGQMSIDMFKLDPDTLVLFKKKVEGLIDSFQQFGLI